MSTRRYRRLRRCLVLSIGNLFLTLAVTSVAQAGYEKVGAFMNGELTPLSLGVASDYANGEVYIADGFNSRVVRLDPEGKVLGAFGWDVVETGPDKAGTDLEEEIIVAATGGEYSIKYVDSEAKIGATESADEVAEDVENLPSVRSRHGKVHVVGGPGDKTGSQHYVVKYEGGIGDQQQNPLKCKNESLSGGEPSSSVTCPVLTNGSPAFENCVKANGDVCRSSGVAGEGEGQFLLPEADAVRQSTGDIYVLSEHKTGVVQIFNSSHQPTSSFGLVTNKALESTPGVEDEPEELRRPTDVAVDDAGTVYILDKGSTNALTESRVVVFKLVGGKYEYSGVIGRQCGLVACVPTAVAVDGVGNVYIVGGQGKKLVHEISPEPEALICESDSFTSLEGLAVGLAGEVVVFDPDSKLFYEFRPCNGGHLTKSAEFAGIDQGKKVALASGIALNPTIRYRNEGERPKGVIYAVNPGETTSGELNEGVVFAQAKVAHPKVVAGSMSVTDVGSTSAALRAKIMTASNATHYRFLYSTESIAACSVDHSCLEAPSGGAVVGVLPGEESVSATIGGLEPGATYHFGISGFSNCNAEAPGEECMLEGSEDRKFMTFAPATGLPDERAYEMVSPPIKDGGEVFPALPFAQNCNECYPGIENQHFPMQSAPDGNSIVYEGNAFSPTGETVNANEYLATRSKEEGWQTRDLSSALQQSSDPTTGFKGFTFDLRKGVFAETGPTLCPDAPAVYADLYLVGGSCRGEPGFEPLLTLATPHERPAASLSAPVFGVTFGGGSVDFGSVVFEANDALLTGSGVLEEELTKAVAGEVTNGESNNHIYEWSGGRLTLVDVLPNGKVGPGAVLGAGNPVYTHAVSADGSRVFWTNDENGRVYVRENGAETLKIGDLGGFLTADGDGSRVLLNDGHVFDVDAESVSTDLTEGKGGFVGLLGASEDLSTVYFVDEAILSSEENAFGAKAQAGKTNLYVSQGGAPARFIAVLAGGGDGANGVAFGLLNSLTGDWTTSPSSRTAQVTSDGRFLTFMSSSSLTRYDNTPAGGRCGLLPSGSCYEVYEYDSLAGQLICVSCDPTGERPSGSATLSLIRPGSGFLPQPQNLSDNGRVFFDSIDSLSPQTHNAGVQDVYEYEPDGVGTCGRSSGCIFLISSGTGEANSNFLAATPTGSDVFFTTRFQLLPGEDSDDLIDLYDAREHGGFPQSPQVRECTTGATCQSSSPASPQGGETPPSESTPGGGNLTAPPPPSVPVGGPTPHGPTRAQLLAKALKACQKHKTKRQRTKCAAKARKRYGAKASTKSAKAGRRSTRTR